MTALEIIDERCGASGLPGPEDFDEGAGSIAAPAVRDRRISSTASAMPTASSTSRRLGGARASKPRGGCRIFPTMSRSSTTATPTRPFRLVAAPSRSFLNTSFNNTPSSVAREGRPTALLHPDALADLGIADGDRVRLGNGKGSVVVHARAFDGLQQRVVIVEGIWPNHAFEEGIGINVLTSADPGRRSGGAVFHDTAVWLRPA